MAETDPFKGQTQSILKHITREGFGQKVHTILGSNPEHVFREKRRLGRQISADPLAGAAVFGTAETPFFGGGSFSEKFGYIRDLGKKATLGTLTDEEKEFLVRQAKFGERHGLFNRLRARREEVVKQREAVEAFRRRSPGRSQTILTRRES